MNHTNGASLPQSPHISLPIEPKAQKPSVQTAPADLQAIAPIVNIPKKLDIPRKTISQHLPNTGLIVDTPIYQAPTSTSVNQEVTEIAIPITAEEETLLQSRAETTATREAMTTLARERAHRIAANRELAAIMDLSVPLDRIHC